MLRRVLALFRAGKFIEAHDKALSLDTIVRDVIPFACWRRMTEARVDDRKKAGAY